MALVNTLITKGTNFANDLARYVQACGKKSILQTKPIGKIDIKGLKYIEPYKTDIVELSETASFIRDLGQCYKVKPISIKVGTSKTPFTMFEGSQMGSNPAFWARNNSTGELFYVKLAKNIEAQGHLESEVLATKLYNLAGFETPTLKVAKLEDGTTCILSKFKEGSIPSSNAKLNEGFATDAWLANWDSLITGNTLIKNGKVIKVDCGGALKYRAQGTLKTNFNDRVEELVSLTNGINSTSASVYGQMSHAEIVTSLKRVASISDESINLVVQDTELANILINRKRYLTNILKEMEKTPYQGSNMSSYFTKLDDVIQKQNDRVQRNIQRMLQQKESGQRTITYLVGSDDCQVLSRYGINSYDDLINSKIINSEDIDVITRIYNNAKNQGVQNLFDENLDLLVNFANQSRRVNGKLVSSYEMLTKEQLLAMKSTRDQLQSGVISEDVCGAVLSRISASIPHKVFDIPLGDKAIFIKEAQKVTGEDITTCARYFDEITTLNVFLKKQSLPAPINVQRVETFAPLNNIKVGNTTLGQLMQETTNSGNPRVVEELINKANFEIPYNNFVGTSLQDLGYIVNGYPIKMNITLEKGYQAAVLPTSVPPLYTRFDELEVLLQMGSKLKINNATFKDNVWHLDVLAKL